MMEGNLTEARNNFLIALRTSFDANSIPIAIDSLLGLAQLYLQDGELERVLELSYYILNHPSSTQEAKNLALQLRAQLEVELTHQEIELVQQRSGAKTFTTIVNDILRQTGNA